MKILFLHISHYSQQYLLNFLNLGSESEHKIAKYHNEIIKLDELTKRQEKTIADLKDRNEELHSRLDEYGRVLTKNKLNHKLEKFNIQKIPTNDILELDTGKDEDMNFIKKLDNHRLPNLDALKLYISKFLLFNPFQTNLIVEIWKDFLLKECQSN